MQTLEAEFEIVTPMFMGGADNRATAELRLPSIKAALRFWWRAMAWGRTRGSEAERLAELWRWEAGLFGTSDAKIGQGKFLMAIKPQCPRAQIAAPPGPRGNPAAVLKDRRGRAVMPGARYLGYGLMQAFYRGANPANGITERLAGELDRSCIQECQTFIVSVRFKPDVPASQIEEIRRAVVVFGMIGSLGSRSRRGWGSVALLRIRESGGEWEECLPESPRAYSEKLRLAIGDKEALSKEEPDYLPLTTFAMSSRIVAPAFSANLMTEMRVNSATWTSLECLAALGSALNLYRSWGRNGNVRVRERPNVDLPADRRFVDDHHWFKQIAGHLLPPDFHPERVVFGLPHNYSGIDVTGTDVARRASPMLIHIHRTRGGQYFPIVSVLPSRFLPDVVPRLPAERRQWAAAAEFSRQFQYRIHPPANVLLEARTTVRMSGIQGHQAVPDNPNWGILTRFLTCTHIDGASSISIL